MCVFLIQGVYYGDLKEFDQLIQPLIENLPKPDLTNITSVVSLFVLMVTLLLLLSHPLKRSFLHPH